MYLSNTLRSGCGQKRYPNDVSFKICGFVTTAHDKMFIPWVSFIGLRTTIYSVITGLRHSGYPKETPQAQTSSSVRRFIDGWFFAGLIDKKVQETKRDRAPEKKWFGFGLVLIVERRKGDDIEEFRSQASYVCRRVYM